jgi:glycosyltransferase involved in cell wall biosynthesis
MRLAIVHDHLGAVGGAEQVLFALHRLWPEAPIYLLSASGAAIRTHLPRADVRVARLGRIATSTRAYAALAPLWPSAAESLDLSSYDTVLSNSVMFSKGVIVRPDTRHISYTYSPPRMLWDRHADYERRGLLSSVTRHALRAWDASAAQRPDQLIAISRTTAARIGTYWRRDARILPPPTDAPFEVAAYDEGHPYWLVVGRLVPHKMLHTAVLAANRTKARLIIAGEGPLKRALMRIAGPTVRLTGRVEPRALSSLYAGATATIVPNEEDWGLTAVESMLHGTPVLALRRGGATETVLEGVTGEFYDDAIPEALAEGMLRVRSSREGYDTGGIKRHAAQWSHGAWEDKMRKLIAQ